MLVWDEGERKILREVERLKDVFDDFKFCTTIFRIPSRNQQCRVAQQIDRLQCCDPWTLLIVYYSGHGGFFNHEQEDRQDCLETIFFLHLG
jgi:hypothetical protein